MARLGEQAELEYNQVAAERIRGLSTIDQQLPKVLRSVAIAVSALTNSPAVLQSAGPVTDSVNLRKQIIQEKTLEFMRLVKEVDDGLHDQVTALEKANIIPEVRLVDSGAASNVAQADNPDNKPGGQGDNYEDALFAAAEAGWKEPTVTNNGLGNLDIGILNSRTGSLREGLDANLLARVQANLDDMLRTSKKDTKR